MKATWSDVYLIPALEWLRQEDHEFKASLVYNPGHFWKNERQSGKRAQSIQLLLCKHKYLTLIFSTYRKSPA